MRASAPRALLDTGVPSKTPCGCAQMMLSRWQDLFAQKTARCVPTVGSRPTHCRVVAVGLVMPAQHPPRRLSALQAPTPQLSPLRVWSARPTAFQRKRLPPHALSVQSTRHQWLVRYASHSACAITGTTRWGLPKYVAVVLQGRHVPTICFITALLDPLAPAGRHNAQNVCRGHISLLLVALSV